MLFKRNNIIFSDYFVFLLQPWQTAFRRVHNAHYVNDPTDIRNLKDK